MDATSSEKAPTVVIQGISWPQQQRLLDVLTQQADVDAIWLLGSRAMGRERPGSDIDLCVDAARLTHRERLRLMAAIDDLLLPWTVVFAEDAINDPLALLKRRHGCPRYLILSTLLICLLLEPSAWAVRFAYGCHDRFSELSSCHS